MYIHVPAGLHIHPMRRVHVIHVHEFTKTILLRLSRCSNCYMYVSVSFWNLPKNFRVYTCIASQFEFKLHDMLMRDAEGRKKEASKAIQTTQSKAHVHLCVHDSRGVEQRLLPSPAVVLCCQGLVVVGQGLGQLLLAQPQPTLQGGDAVHWVLGRLERRGRNVMHALIILSSTAFPLSRAFVQIIHTKTFTH